MKSPTLLIALATFRPVSTFADTFSMKQHAEA
jgi:hypothetical protein